MVRKKESYRVLSLDERIKRLENKKNVLLRELEEVESKLNQTYLEKLSEDSSTSVRISLGDLKQEMETIKGNKIKEFELYALSSFYNDEDEKGLKDSKESMDFFGSRLFIVFDDNTMVWYNHLNLFDNFDDEQKDGSILLDHCSTRSRGCSKMKDLIVDYDIDNVIGNFNFSDITSDRNHCDNYDLLPKAIFNCIKNNKADFLYTGYQKRK